MEKFNPNNIKFEYAIGYALESLNEEIIEAMVKSYDDLPEFEGNMKIDYDEASEYLVWLIYYAKFVDMDPREDFSSHRIKGKRIANSAVVKQKKSVSKNYRQKRKLICLKEIEDE